jgi:hypothetical protein
MPHLLRTLRAKWKQLRRFDISRAGSPPRRRSTHAYPCAILTAEAAVLVLFLQGILPIAVDRQSALPRVSKALRVHTTTLRAANSARDRDRDIKNETIRTDNQFTASMKFGFEGSRCRSPRLRSRRISICITFRPRQFDYSTGRMALHNILRAAVLLIVSSALVASCFAQSDAAQVAMATPAASPLAASPDAAPAQVAAAAAGVEEGIGMLNRIGVGVKISTLGVGAEAAFELSRHFNIRGGMNYFSYGHNFTNSGINYGGTLRLESGEAHLDYFIGRSFHVSPGLLIYNGNQLNANITVPAGQSFTLSNTTYTSSSTVPVTGTGMVKFKRVDPSFMFGFGNLVPRGRHRFSVNFEMGAVYQDAPMVNLNMVGNVCDSTGANCQNVASNPTFQSDLQAQQGKYNHDVSAFRFYPVISLGFGFRL